MKATAATEDDPQEEIKIETDSSVEDQTDSSSQHSSQTDPSDDALPCLENGLDPLASDHNSADSPGAAKSVLDKCESHTHKGKNSVLPLKKVKSNSGKSTRQCTAREGFENSSAVINVAGGRSKSTSKQKKQTKKLKASQKRKVKCSLTKKKRSGNKSNKTKESSKHLYKT